MKKDRLTWMFAIGLLGLLGFSSCSPRLRARRATINIDSLRIVPGPGDSTGIKPLPFPGETPPIKLMYGVPPARYELKRIDDGQAKSEIQ